MRSWPTLMATLVIELKLGRSAQPMSHGQIVLAVPSRVVDPPTRGFPMRRGAGGGLGRQCSSIHQQAKTHHAPTSFHLTALSHGPLIDPGSHGAICI
jgi:hypothetical protein